MNSRGWQPTEQSSKTTPPLKGPNELRRGVFDASGVGNCVADTVLRVSPGAIHILPLRGSAAVANGSKVRRGPRRKAVVSTFAPVPNQGDR